MIKTSKYKRIIAFILLIITMLSLVQPIFAVSGTGSWVGGQFASYIKTTDNANSQYGVLLRKLINYNTNEQRTVFCAEHGVDFYTSTIYKGSYYTPANSSIRKACRIAYLGWYKEHGSYVIDGGTSYADKKQYVLTQQFIWETLGQSNATFIDSGIQAEYESFKNSIENQIAQIEKRPSFDGTILNIQAGESKTFEDSNGVLSNYPSLDNTINGIRVQHSGGSNSITITVDENTNLENYTITDAEFKSWGMVKDGTQDKDTMVYFEFADGVQNQLYCMDYNDPITLSFSVKIEAFGSLELEKYNKNQDLIDGSVFEISGANYSNQVTVEGGKIKIDKLKKGTYTIKEISAQYGYLLNTENYKIEIKPNQTTKQIVVNEEPTGIISLVKEDSKTGNIPQGNASFNGASYEISADEDIYNVARTKKFYSKGDIVATRIINENGTTDDITNLPLGKYKIKETKSSEGYLLDTNEYIVELKYKDQNTKVITSSVLSKEVVKKMQVHIFKSGIKTQSGVVQGLAGAEFTIKLASDVEIAYEKGYSYEEVWNGIDKDGNKVSINDKRVQEAQEIAPTYDTVVTDENGNCYTKELPYGKYIGKETNTPKDFETATDFYFSITQDKSEITELAKKVKHIFINNEQLETYIKLIKKDKNTGKVVTASSATFKIRATEDIYDRGNGKILYKKGDTIKQKIGSTTYETFTTNANNLIVPAKSYNSKNDDKGTVVTPLKLEVGSYEICEILEPNGFLILQDTVKFKVDGIRNYDQDSDKDYILKIEIKNEQPTGTLLLDKSIVLRDNVDKSLINITDYSKIKFRLTAKDNIIDKADNKIIYKAGKEIGIYNLTKEGTLKIDNLPMGSYQIQEIETLDGLVLNNKKYDVIFTQKDNTTKVYEEKLNIENKTTIFEFSKTDITGDKELVGAKLKVIDSKGKIVDSWTSTEETHKIEGLVVGKEYTMIEEIAIGNFVKATPIKFKIKNTTEIQKITMIDKLVTVSKVDITTGEELEGASLRVVDEEDNVIDEWISTKEVHKVKDLEEGKTYFLEETTAPYGYEITERIEFTVSTDKETQKIVMKDMPILTSIQLTKIDEDTNEIIKDKFTFGLYADEECKELIQQVDSNKKEGTIIFKDLRYGIYYIKEISAPKNYILSDKVVKLEINDKGVFIDDEEIEEADYIYNFEFTNKIIETPKTGDDRPFKLWFAMLGLSGILLCGIGIYERIKNKKKNK